MLISKVLKNIKNSSKKYMNISVKIINIIKQNKTKFMAVS